MLGAQAQQSSSTSCSPAHTCHHTRCRKSHTVSKSPPSCMPHKVNQCMDNPLALSLALHGAFIPIHTATVWAWVALAISISSISIIAVTFILIIILIISCVSGSRPSLTGPCLRPRLWVHLCSRHIFTSKPCYVLQYEADLKPFCLL